MNHRRFVLQGLFLLVIAGCSGRYVVRPIEDDSWRSGTINIAPLFENGELGVSLTGSWPEANEDLFICLCIAAQQGDSRPILLLGQGPLPLRTFKSSGIGDYQRVKEKNFDPAKPHRLVLEYEIWKGKPTSGKLLTKQTVTTETFDPADLASTSANTTDP